MYSVLITWWECNDEIDRASGNVITPHENRLPVNPPLSLGHLALMTLPEVQFPAVHDLVDSIVWLQLTNALCGDRATNG